MVEGNGGLRIELAEGHSVASPGSRTVVEASVSNSSDLARELELELRGAAAEFGWVSPPRVSVAPGGSVTVRIVFAPPDHARPPGVVSYTLVASARGAPPAVAEVSGGLVDPPTHDVSLELSPRLARARRRSRHVLGVDNRSNVAVRFGISGSGDHVSVACDPSSAEVGPGGSLTVEVTARARLPTLIKRSRRLPFSVTVTDGDGEDHAVSAAMVQEPTTWLLPTAGVFVVAAAFVASALLGRAEAPGGGARAGPVSIAAPEPRFAVSQRSVTFEDTTRPYSLPDGTTIAPTRVLSTRIYYPAAGPAGSAAVADAPVDVGGGPYPVIVFAHGSGGGEYPDLVRAWAAAGYFVLAPTFPAASGIGPTNPDDYVEQTEDMSVVLSRFSELAGEQGGWLADAVDLDRVAAAGHSLGAMTTLGLVAAGCCADDRFDAAVLLAGQEVPFPGSELFFDLGVPLLVVHGDRDASVPWANGRLVYVVAPRPKAFLSLAGADHSAPFRGSPQDPHFAAVVGTSIDFLDRYVAEDPEAEARLVSRLGATDTSSFEAEL